MKLKNLTAAVSALAVMLSAGMFNITAFAEVKQMLKQAVIMHIQLIQKMTNIITTENMLKTV